MNKQAVTGGSSAVPTFPEHLRSSLQAFRAALIELLASVEADPGRPQDLARRFGLNKNLTWKISKIVGSPDLYGSVPHIPGAAGLKIFLAAMEKAGAPASHLKATRQAATTFDDMVKLHTGDRNTLEIMVSGMLPGPVQSEQAEQSRKLAYQGNSGVWGVRAKAQIALRILAPNNQDQNFADLVQISGLIGFRRLRPDARWLLFRRERWTDDDPHPPMDVEESIDPDFPVAGGVPLIGEFCSKPIPDLDVIVDAGEVQYELPPGPVGNTASLTCIQGQVSRRIGPAYAEHPGEFTEIGSSVITPVEHLLFDMLVHRDYDWAMNPELLIYSRLDGGAMHASARRERNTLPVFETVHDAGWGAAALASSLVPRYSNLVRHVFDRLEWNADDFRAYRFTMSYPPIPTSALMRAALPVRA
ncbi:MAG: hypothetical protein GY715_07325 [Planctomycetes bacterium]|nr:hypothetical protein [Planctomycetota bacterium]